MRIERSSPLSSYLVGAVAVVLIAAGVVVPAPGAERSAQAGSQNETEGSRSGTPQEQATENSQGGKKSTSRRKNFNPSEKITADTAVSFPVDI